LEAGVVTLERVGGVGRFPEAGVNAERLGGGIFRLGAPVVEVFPFLIGGNFGIMLYLFFPVIFLSLVVYEPSRAMTSTK